MAEFEFEVRRTSEAMKFPPFRILEIRFGSLYPCLQHAQHVLSQSVAVAAVPTVLVLCQCYVPDRIHVQSSFPPPPLQRCRTPSPSQAHRSHSPPDLLLPLPSTNFPLVRWPIGVAGDIKHALIEFSDRSAFMASHNGAPSFAMSPMTHEGVGCTDSGHSQH